MTERRQSALTLAFLDREPRSAARVLQSIDASDAAAFLDRAPARVVAPAVSAMIPWAAARCLERMDPEKASSLLRVMDYSDAVSVVRLIKAEHREALLELSTKDFARRFRNSLIYPKDTVGAWMDVHMPSYQDTALVRDAVRTIRGMPQVASHIFLTDRDRRYAGAVAVADLFRRDENATLAEIADRSVKPISNRESLHACEANAAWDLMFLLPVIGRKQNLVGGLSRRALRKALLAQDAPIRVATPGSVLMQVLSAFVTVGAAFANLTLLQADEARQTHNRETRRAGKRKNRDQ